MQFHLNGFSTGDPEFSPLPLEPVPTNHSNLPTEVDVLIVGCGPAGLTLAAQLSAFPGITTCIVEQKAGPLELGQADGIACRTMEMFNAFGFADRVLREGYWVNETSFWQPDAENPKRIVRSGRVLDTEPGLSEFPHVILNQARVHDFYLDRMRKSQARLSPRYGRRLVQLEVDRAVDQTEDLSALPVTAKFERNDVAGDIETVRAKFVVGCDGARSTVRREMGLTLAGDSADRVWGVMDVLAVTDFPDFRLKAVINSACDGGIIFIPREGGYLVRIYVELDELERGERAAHRNMTSEHIIAAANRVLHPYVLDVRQVAWWSIYEIGQRLSERFDDLERGAEDTGVPRVFIAGDACHTHSPKAGQGMNVSMQDAFNLGWKLAAVLGGLSPAQLLRTYSEERQPVARELIEFDRNWAAMLSAPRKSTANPTSGGIDPIEVQTYFVRHGRYTAGTATHYPPALLTAEATYQSLAAGFVIGTRFHSAPVVRLADAKPMHLGHCIEADGRWRLFAFAAREEPSRDSKIRRLCDFLIEDPRSPILRHTPQGADLDAVIDVRAIIQQPHDTLDVQSLPSLLRPHKGKFGLCDYEKAFCADPEAGDIFELREINRNKGCIVIVRPDQYVAHLLPLDASDELSDFFSRFMVITHAEPG